MTKKNEPMVFLTIEDLNGQMDVTAFPSVYRDYKDVIAQDAVVVVRGKTNHRERPGSDGETSCEIGIICESIQVLTNGNGNGNKNGNGGPKCLTIRLTNSDREKLKHLRGVFSKHSGESPVYFMVASCGKTTKVSAQAKVEPSPKLISEIEQVLGKSVVTVEQG
jgi:DNA polymerase-3 subunit alpha